MKILFVAHSSDISGGANRSLLSLMVNLRSSKNFWPCILMPSKKGALYDICKKENIPVYIGQYHTCCTVYKKEARDVLRFIKLFVAPFVDKIYAYRLKKILPTDLDVVYTNERMIVVGGYIARLLDIPHIWHVRSFSTENNTHYPPFYYYLMNRYSNKIVLISNALYKSFSKKIDATKLRMIHNGVNVKDYTIECKEPHEGYNILLTGRLVPPKGQLEAIKALEILSNTTDYQFTLFLAGDSPSYDNGEYEALLRKYIIETGLQNNVRFLGNVEKIVDLRKSMDFELVCSWCETFGRVTVEAMCARLIVIGSDSGGTPEIIIDKRTGLLYPPQDTKKLAEQILWCINNPSEASKFRENAYSRVKEEFSIESTVQNVHDTIVEVQKTYRRKYRR